MNMGNGASTLLSVVFEPVAVCFAPPFKINPNSFSRNKIQVINILLPVPVVIPKISHSISRLGFLLSLTRVNTKCSLVVSLASSFMWGWVTEL